jgi:hypothetical protein
VKQGLSILADNAAAEVADSDVQGHLPPAGCDRPLIPA